MLNGWLIAGSTALLMVGNSYTARNQLVDRVADRMESAPTEQEVRGSSVTLGGARWADHSQLLSDPDSALSRAMEKRVWDTWVLQEQSQILGFPEAQSERQMSLQAAVELAEAASQVGADTHLFLTWGRRLGDARNPTRYPDYLTMQDLLTDGYLSTAQALEERGHAVGVAPVGEAFRRVYLDDVAGGEDPEASRANFSRLYTKDGSHPSMYGTLLASAVIEASLTGRVHAFPDAAGAVDDEALLAYLDGVSRSVVLDDPFGVYPYPWATVWDGGDPVAVMGVSERPALSFASDATLSVLEVGGALEGATADGEVWVQADASVVTSRLVFGAGGDNAVVVNGGDLVVSSWSAGDGRILLRAGQFTVGSMSDNTGTVALVWDGGIFEVSGDVQTQMAVDQPESGILQLGPEANLAIADGVFRGTIRVTGLLGEQADVLVADRLDLTDARVEVPEGVRWEVVSVAKQQALRLRRGAQLEVDASETPEGCGCDASTGQASSMWLLALLVGWSRRHRR